VAGRAARAALISSSVVRRVTALFHFSEGRGRAALAVIP
jgi:hypothetical protein